MIRLLIRWLRFCVLCILVPILVGCGSNAPQPEESTVKGLAVCYGRYLSSHQGKPPPSEKEFKQFIAKTIPQEMLVSFGGSLDNLDGFFTSNRDKEPYQVRYGVRLPPGMIEAVVVWEKTGIGGKHMVGYATGKVAEVDQAKLKELVPRS